LFISRLLQESIAESRLAPEFFKDFCCYMLGMNNPAPAGAGWRRGLGVMRALMLKLFLRMWANCKIHHVYIGHPSD